jgi:hypothetical protein
LTVRWLNGCTDRQECTPARLTSRSRSSRLRSTARSRSSRYRPRSTSDCSRRARTHAPPPRTAGRCSCSCWCRPIPPGSRRCRTRGPQCSTARPRTCRSSSSRCSTAGIPSSNDRRRRAARRSTRCRSGIARVAGSTSLRRRRPDRSRWCSRTPWPDAQHPTPHSGPASGAQQRFCDGSTQCWPVPQKKNCLVEVAVLQHSEPAGAQYWPSQHVSPGAQHSVPFAQIVPSASQPRVAVQLEADDAEDGRDQRARTAGDGAQERIGDAEEAALRGVEAAVQLAEIAVGEDRAGLRGRRRARCALHRLHGLREGSLHLALHLELRGWPAIGEGHGLHGATVHQRRDGCRRLRRCNPSG